MKRLLTAAIGTFRFPPSLFFAAIAVCFGLAAVELVRLARTWAPNAPLRLLPVLAIALAALLSFPRDRVSVVEEVGLLALLSLGAGLLLLLSRTPIAEVPAALGTFSFGVPYIALPIAGFCLLQQEDPWLVFLLMAIVWLGDTAAYYVGSHWGRHKLAPTVSPKKTWEGAIASLLTSLIAAGVWSFIRLDRVSAALLAVALATPGAGPVGGLGEAIFKRAAQVKDSGHLLPGHGGVLDRVDALMFAAPVLWLGWRLAHPWI